MQAGWGWIHPDAPAGNCSGHREPCRHPNGRWTATAQALHPVGCDVQPDDVKELVPAVLSHRIVLTPAARMRGVRAEHLVDELLNTVPVPGAQ